LSHIEQFQALLPQVAGSDLAAYHPSQEAAFATGVRLLWLFTCFLARVATPQATLAETLQQAWAPHDSQVTHLLNAALILNADHELSIPAFTARCIASTGTTLYGAIQGALAAFHGVQSKKKLLHAFRFVRSIGESRQVQQVLVEHLKQGEDIPGFEHHLFPAGDARPVMLLSLLHAHYPQAPETRLVETLVAEVEKVLGIHPRIELAYAALALILGLTDEQALTLFALARCIGWIGHALEQAWSQQGIRPRARYTGRQP
ncbi:MAG TPA: citrate/2-methylcitrate synthase, partial [Ktedonobacteraceae bacterium]|nr:citrate/2-methylcitrate synthase [Ktedonobacteraceae bacterium]